MQMVDQGEQVGRRHADGGSGQQGEQVGGSASCRCWIRESRWVLKIISSEPFDTAGIARMEWHVWCQIFHFQI